MSNNATNIEGHLKASEIDEAAIVKYLKANPDFFINHAELLTETQTNQATQGVVSLTQIQLDQYRTKVKKQKKQLQTFIENAQDNEKLYLTYADLNFAISKAQTLTELESTLKQYLCDKLSMTAANLILLKSGENQVPELPHHSLLHKKLAKRDFYLGRLSKHEKDALFGDIKVGSVALIKIDSDVTTAILSIATDNDVHFSPDMDTKLLNYVRVYLEYHLPRLLTG